MSRDSRFDCLIVGGGMVGLCIAYQLLERNIAKRILIVEKEKSLGLHNSGRNSGVLHAGIYYKPHTLKAKTCINGAKRLKEWAQKKNIKINNCGKLIVAQKEDQLRDLENLAERGKSNGVDLEIVSEKTMKEKCQHVNSKCGYAIWSPKTSVINPKDVIQSLHKELEARGVVFAMGINAESAINTEANTLVLEDGTEIEFNYLFNCGGMHADKIAHKQNVGMEYSLIPIKGLYWKLREECTINISTNIYPIPDLNVPFLGIHFTPGAYSQSSVSIGPTAIPSLGRENYKGYENIQPGLVLKSLGIIMNQYILNQNKFRRYVHEQAFLAIKPLIFREARLLVPEIQYSDIIPSSKVGIRPQLFNHAKNSIEDDFVCINKGSTTHILNAISPAFTASFELADVIIDRSQIHHPGAA